MASPLGHTAVGYALYRGLKDRFPGRVVRGRWRAPLLFVAAAGCSLLPDADAVLGVLAGNLGRFHNNLSHSLLFGALLALSGAAVMRALFGGCYADAVRFIFLGYALHLALDYCTYGRGVMLFWPLSEARFKLPVNLFYGVRWSDGLGTWKHLLTLLNEAAYVGVAWLAVRRWRRRRAAASPPAVPP